MSDYTPTTEEVRTDYALYAWSDKFERSMRSDSFDRWLAEHDRQHRAIGWSEGWLIGCTDAQYDLAVSEPTENPYQEKEQ